MYTIIGSNGFIGRNLHQHLIELNQEVTCITRTTPLDKDFDYGVVFYCGGLPAGFNEKPFETVQSHVINLQNWLENYKFRKLVYLSSTRIYLPGTDTDESSFQILVNIEELYCLSKLLAEGLSLKSRRKVIIARVSNVVGDNFLASQVLFYNLCREAKKSGGINFQETPYSSRDYISVKDVARYLYLMGENDTKHTIYNLASGINITNQELISIINKYIRLDKISYGERTVVFPTVNVNRLHEEFGNPLNSPQHAIEEALKHYES
jgi:nucleoside-diphosphate-sugar epimerase